MFGRVRWLLHATALGAMVAAPAAAQIQLMGTVPAARLAKPVARAQPRPMPTPTPTPGRSARSGPDVLAPVNPDFKADQPPAAQIAPIPVPLPPVIWDIASA